MSATLTVVRPRETKRYSFAFFYKMQGYKWVELLSQFTKEIKVQRILLRGISAIET